MPRPLLGGLAAAACAAALCGAAPRAAAATAQVTIEVPAGKAKVVRLRHLPRGTLIAVLIKASGRLVVALRSATQIRSKSPDAVFRGALERKITFKIVIQETDDYYLVLDNRRGAEPVKTTTTIEAVAGKRKQPDKQKPAPPKGGKFEETRT